MGNCLKTQLKGNVNNDNLIKLGEIQFDIPATQSISLFPGGDRTCVLRNKTGYFRNKTTGVLVKEITLSAALTDYAVDQKSTVVAATPGTLIYLQLDNSMADDLYNLCYTPWAQTLFLKNINNVPFGGTLEEFCDIVSGYNSTLGRLSIKEYDLSSYELSDIVNHSKFSQKFANINYLVFAGCKLNIDVSDIANFNSLPAFVLYGNIASGTIESFVAAMRIKRPNISSFTFEFSCMDDRNRFTATFKNKNICLYEDTYYASHTVEWDANTISFMGETTNA